jgi:hypothetical protein
MTEINPIRNRLDMRLTAEDIANIAYLIGKRLPGHDREPATSTEVVRYCLDIVAAAHKNATARNR